jgi:hypothetical protein
MYQSEISAPRKLCTPALQTRNNIWCFGCSRPLAHTQIAYCLIGPLATWDYPIDSMNSHSKVSGHMVRSTVLAHWEVPTYLEIAQQWEGSYFWLLVAECFWGPRSRKSMSPNFWDTICKYILILLPSCTKKCCNTHVRIRPGVRFGCKKELFYLPNTMNMSPENVAPRNAPPMSFFPEWFILIFFGFFCICQ